MNDNDDKKPFVVKGDDSSIGSSGPKPLSKRFEDLDNLVKAVLFVLLIMVATMLVATFNTYIDQAHFNNETYDNYKNEQGIVQNELNGDNTKINQLQNEVKSLKSGHSTN